MVVLYFSCNFDVVVGGCKYHVYLYCHLDRKPPHCLFLKCPGALLSCAWLTTAVLAIALYFSAWSTKVRFLKDRDDCAISPLISFSNGLRVKSINPSKAYLSQPSPYFPYLTLATHVQSHKYFIQAQMSVPFYTSDFAQATAPSETSLFSPTLLPSSAG